MSKKVYNHNDYYGYINKIEEMAIGNPEWFWSNSKDATEARQWLQDNGAGAIKRQFHIKNSLLIKLRKYIIKEYEIQLTRLLNM